MRMPKMPGFKKRRKYPIKRDDSGKSARKRCFEMFEDAYTLSEVMAYVNVPKSTVYKYHQQWLKDPHIEQQLAYLKPMFDKENPNRDKSINQLALLLDIQRQEVERLLASPHGLRRLLTCGVVLPGHEREYYKRYMSLTLGILFADHLINDNGRFEDIYYAFRQLLKQYRQAREEETTEHNETLERVRRLLETIAKNEANGQTERGKLTDEEINNILIMQRDKYLKSIETKYWIGISELMHSGISKDQAREQMYQETLAAGDAKLAKELRDYQDKVHPLKISQPPQSAPVSDQKST